MKPRSNDFRRSDPAGSGISDGHRSGIPLVAACVAALAIGWAGSAPAAGPAAGDVYVYRLVNAYNKEVQGQLRYEVSKVDSGGLTVEVTPDTAEGGVQRTDVYTHEGNWLRHPLDSHDQAVEYQFATAYPAYVFPLEPGKTWSIRVKASVPGEARPRSVRVDGKVIGAERISVPAGEFDTIKVRRFVYPDDTYYTTTETQITEVDWYSPALGRPVRTERKSSWLDVSRCTEQDGCDFRGAWSVFELVQASAAN